MVIQISNSIAIGTYVGRIKQGFPTGAFEGSAIAIGTEAGYTGQRANSIAIGLNAGRDTGQSAYSIAIGLNAGRRHTRWDSIAIGKNAAKTETTKW